MSGAVLTQNENLKNAQDCWEYIRTYVANFIPKAEVKLLTVDEHQARLEVSNVPENELDELYTALKSGIGGLKEVSVVNR